MPGTRMTNYFQGYDDQQEDISDQGTSPISVVSAGPSSGATLITPGPSSRAGPSPRELRFSTPSIPSSSGTPTVIFNRKRKFHQAETDEEEIDSSLEESEHNITFNDEDTEVEDEVEVKKSDGSTGDTEDSKGKKGKGKQSKRQKLSPIKLPVSSFILSEAELRQQRNIMERNRQYEEYEQRRVLEQGQQTSDNILGLDFDDDNDIL